METAEWVDLGCTAIVQLLEIEHAVVWLEVEAKIADHVWQPLGRRIQPHHLTTARQQLRRAGVIEQTVAKTRGGREVPVIHLAKPRSRVAVARAAARKRLLMTRYLRWAMGESLLGPEGERALHTVLSAVASAHGYRLERPDGGRVANLFGEPVPGGELDSAAHLQLVDDHGVTRATVTLPIEVKNVREGIYPDSERLHQVLYKAARLKEARPDVPIVPVLVCRRASYTTFDMAKALGFYVADARTQFVPNLAEVTPRLVDEVSQGLGFTDLAQEQTPNRLLRAHFSKATDADPIHALTLPPS